MAGPAGYLRAREHLRLRWKEQAAVDRSGVLALRYAWLLALAVPLAALGARHPAPPVPTGHDLYRLPVAEFQAYVSGVYDGQAALANALGMRPIICLDPRMTRSDLARLVLSALPKLPAKVMDLPANDVVLRVLVENARCPDVT